MKQIIIIFCLLCSQTLASSGSVTPDCTCYSDRIVQAQPICLLNKSPDGQCKTNDGVIRNGWKWAKCTKVNCPAYMVVGASEVTAAMRATDCSASAQCGNGQGPCNSDNIRQCESGHHCMIRQFRPNPLGYNTDNVGDQANFCGHDYVHAPTRAPTQLSRSLNVADPATSESGIPGWGIALIVIGSIGCLAILAIIAYNATIRSWSMKETRAVENDSDEGVRRESIVVDDMTRDSVGV